jgi:hypothetical protein
MISSYEYMSEVFSDSQPKPEDPELLPCQTALKNFCDDILRLKPEGLIINFWEIGSSIDPEYVQQRLRSSRIGDLLLRDGDSLSWPGEDDYYPDLGLYIGSAALDDVSVRAIGKEYDKARPDPNGPKEPPFKVLTYPGEKDWVRQLDIRLHYSERDVTATQSVTTRTSSDKAGLLPSLSRDVASAAYASHSYEGHNQVWREAHNQGEVQELLAIAQEIIDKQ